MYSLLQEMSDFQMNSKDRAKIFECRNSGFVRIRSLLDRFNKNRISKTENYIRLKISNANPVVRVKFRANVLLFGYSWRDFVKKLRFFLTS